MPDIYLCAHCGSTYLQHAADRAQCLECGNCTDLFDGSKIPVEPVFEGDVGGRRERPV